MLGKLTGWDDTIVALATPPGIGAIGVIRLGGIRSVEIANDLFPSKDLLLQASHSLHVGLLKEGDQLLDEVVVSIYRAPGSYTGEDVVEISCHGSPHIQERILQACLSKGARLARAGEFTQRAFLNGKMDLTQAEAVADLIASHSEASRKSALHTMRGGFANELKSLREQLLGFSALIELELDFSQEDVEFADRKKFYALIEDAQQVTDRLIESFRFGNVIRNGVQVAIVGKPNAGKSTLLNTLLNERRAIVSEIAGTTRDTIEEVVMIEGIQFRLIDTAGIRAHTEDQIEHMGMEKSREKIAQADIVLQILDATDVQVEEELSVDERKLLRVLNKSDDRAELERPRKNLPARANARQDTDSAVPERHADSQHADEFHRRIKKRERKNGVFKCQHVRAIDFGKLCARFFLAIEELDHAHPGDVFLEERINARNGGADAPVGVAHAAAKHQSDQQNKRQHAKRGQSQAPVER